MSEASQTSWLVGNPLSGGGSGKGEEKGPSHVGVRVPAMKYAYPAAVAELSNDPPLALALRIARHSPCDACPCRRLQPPHDAHIFLDASQPVQTHSLDHLGQYGSDDDEISPDYLDVCECGHSVPQHGADETTVGRLEFLRRGRVATRLDEQLQVSVAQGAGALLRLRASHFLCHSPHNRF